MAVVSCYETRERRGGIDQKGQRTYTRTWEVLTDDVNDGPQIASTGTGIPAIGTAYTTGTETDNGAYVIALEMTQHSDDPLRWTAVASYSSVLTDVQTNGNPTAPEQATANVAPLSRPNRERGTFRTEEAYPRRDLDGFPIVNSAGEPFEDQKPIERNVQVISIEKFVASISYAELRARRGAVNDDTWRGNDAKTAKIAGLDYELVVENNTACVKLNYTVEIREEPWDPVYYLDAGHHVIRDGKLVQAVDELTGQPYANAVLLDGAGAQLAVGLAEQYVAFRHHNTIDFDTLF